MRELIHLEQEEYFNVFELVPQTPQEWMSIRWEGGFRAAAAITIKEVGALLPLRLVLRDLGPRHLNDGLGRPATQREPGSFPQVFTKEPVRKSTKEVAPLRTDATTTKELGT